MRIKAWQLHKLANKITRLGKPITPERFADNGRTRSISPQPQRRQRSRELQPGRRRSPSPILHRGRFQQARTSWHVPPAGVLALMTATFILAKCHARAETINSKPLAITEGPIFPNAVSAWRATVNINSEVATAVREVNFDQWDSSLDLQAKAVKAHAQICDHYSHIRETQNAEAHKSKYIHLNYKNWTQLWWSDMHASCYPTT